MRKRRSIIFLDVDGPINTLVNVNAQRQRKRPVSSYHIKLPEQQLTNLATIVKATGADIVLSSKWRLLDERLDLNISPARINLEKQLARHGLTIFSQTPFIDHNRGAEINTWLYNFSRRSGYTPAYIVIDDKLDPIIHEHKGHIVYCNPNRGIGETEVNVAINLLRRQGVIINDP